MNHTVETVARITGKTRRLAEIHWRDAKRYARIQGHKGHWVVVLQHFQRLCGMEVNPLVSKLKVESDPTRPWIVSGEIQEISPEWVKINGQQYPLIILL